jgi:antitoxin component YwqK of YwqJK toxin-antitoxin module
MSKIEINIENYLNGEKKEKEVIWLWKEDGLHTDWYENGK